MPVFPPDQSMLQTSAEKDVNAEQWSAFNQLADRRYADILAGGKTLSWADMRAYLEHNLARQSR